MSTNSNKIAEIRKRKKVTQQELADRMGVHTITVSKLERGVMQLTSTWLERIAKALDVSEIELWGGFKLKQMEANGRLLNGGRIIEVSAEENTFSTYLEPLGDLSSRWIHVQDDALLPYFGEGDLVQFSLVLVRDLQADSVFDGRICLYATEAGGPVAIGIMETDHNNGTCDIRNFNGQSMKNLKVATLWYFSGYQPNWGIIAHFDTQELANPA